MIVGQIVFYGWQNKWKKSDWKKAAGAERARANG
jgi:hypothetical protein